MNIAAADTLMKIFGFRRVEMETQQQIEPHKNYQEIAKSVADLVIEKQKAYGDSFGVAGDFMKLLWPKGIQVESYGDMLTLVRIFDKIKRIATDKDALGENPYQDILGYCLLALGKKND